MHRVWCEDTAVHLLAGCFRYIRDVPTGVSNDIVESMVPLSKSGDFIEVEHGAKAARTVLSIQDADHRQPLGIAIRKGAENAVVENTEDDAGQANSKCQRGYGDGGKAWILSQRAS